MAAPASPEAGVEYHFAAARNPSFAIGLTAFVLIWTGALWLQVVIDSSRYCFS